jgi:hypothetical protein
MKHIRGYTPTEPKICCKENKNAVLCKHYCALQLAGIPTSTFNKQGREERDSPQPPNECA